MWPRHFGLHRRDTRTPIQTKTFLDRVSGAEQIGLEAKLDRNPRSCLVTLTGMPQLGDRSNIVTETLSRKRPVVEIFPGAPIAPIVSAYPSA